MHDEFFALTKILNVPLLSEDAGGADDDGDFIFEIKEMGYGIFLVG